MNRIEKFLDYKVEKAVGEERTYWFVISDESRDRDGDIVVQSTMKMGNFQKNPIILFAHQYDTLPVAQGVEWKTENGRTKMKIKFADKGTHALADDVESCVAQDLLRTVSIGFMVYKSEELTEEDRKMRPEMQYGRRLHAELLEVSFAPVPSNANAGRIRAVRELCMKAYTVEDEKKSALLPYSTADGAVNPRLLKASFAALFGARGGVTLPDQDRKAVHNHLSRIAREAGIEVPEFRIYTPTELREAYADVWHDELRDVIDAAMDAETKEVATSYLLKGNRRAEIQATRDNLSKLLEATEEPPIEEESPAVSRLEKAIESLTENISKVAAA